VLLLGDQLILRILALDGLTALTLAENQDVYTTPEQLSEELVTLTLLPRSRWQTLLNLETITVGFYQVVFDISTGADASDSNGINRKSHQRRRRRHRSSCPRCRVLSKDSTLGTTAR
jgi:hypothetical protein